MKRQLLISMLALCVLGVQTQAAELSDETVSVNNPAPPVSKEKMVLCEPSILIDIMGGATYIDASWRNEVNLDVEFGVQFRNGHGVYAGMGVQRLYRAPEAISRADTRSSRTNMPVFLQYQWRMFGWHKEMADKHSCSPFFGVKAGWNFIPDWNINETVEMERINDLKNNEFITPQIGFDFRCAEYMAFGIVAECEISRRYVGDSSPVNNAAWVKPRIGICLRF